MFHIHPIFSSIKSVFRQYCHVGIQSPIMQVSSTKITHAHSPQHQWLKVLCILVSAFLKTMMTIVLHQAQDLTWVWMVRSAKENDNASDKYCVWRESDRSMKERHYDRMSFSESLPLWPVHGFEWVWQRECVIGTGISKNRMWWEETKMQMIV